MPCTCSKLPGDVQCLVHRCCGPDRCCDWSAPSNRDVSEKYLTNGACIEYHRIGNFRDTSFIVSAVYMSSIAYYVSVNVSQFRPRQHASHSLGPTYIADISVMVSTQAYRNLYGARGLLLGVIHLVHSFCFFILFL